MKYILLFIVFFITATYQDQQHRRHRLKKHKHRKHRRQLKKSNDNKKQAASKQEAVELLQVHVFPHSHMDLAWLDPFEQNYQEHAKPIYLSVIEALSKDSNKTFVFAEGAFLQKFMEDRAVGNDKKEQLKAFVKQGTIELVNGGFAANDHATTYYEDTIDQMTYGHQFIQNTFGVQIESGWNVDTFGGSITDNYLSELMGMRNIFLSRLALQEKERRMKEGSMTMVMDTDNLEHLNMHTKESSFLQLTNKLTNKMKNKNVLLSMSSLHYGFPDKFCIDSTCQKSWKTRDIIDQDDLESKSQAFVELMNKSANGHKNKKLMFFMLGDDFAYIKAQSTFNQFDMLMTHINNNQEQYGLSIQYSTPAQYFQQLITINKSNKLTDKKSDDFFPYQDQPNEYWNGYYTTRPALKYKIRQAGRYLQTIRTYFGFLAFSQQYTDDTNRRQMMAVDRLERALALNQHHDAITGTSKQQVQKGYRQALYSGINATQQLYLKTLDNITKDALGIQSKDFMIYNCDQNDHYYLECSDVYSAMEQGKEDLLLNIYNPSAERTLIMKMKVPQKHIQLTDLRENRILLMDIFCDILSPDFCEMHFQIKLPAFSISYVQVKYLSDSTDKLSFMVKQQLIKVNQNKTLFYNKSDETISINVYNSSINLNINNRSTTIKYQSVSNDFKGGAYVMSPDEESGLQDHVSFKTVQVFKGKLLTILKSDDNTSHIMCILKYYPQSLINDYQDGIIEVNTMVIDPPANKEIILVIQRDNLNNNQTFYTDGNGLSMIKRTTGQQIRDSIYPVTKMITLKDITTKEELTVLTDRSQGGSSLSDGSLHLVIQRQTQSDDSKGMGEFLQENDMIFVTHWLVIGKDNQEQKAREVQMHTDSQPLLNYVQLEVEIDNIIYDNKYTDMGGPFKIDNNVKLYLIYDRWSQSMAQNRFILRLQNFNLACRAQIDITGLTQVTEMGLDYVSTRRQVQDNRKTLPWIEQTDYTDNWTKTRQIIQISLLAGMDIHTYAIDKQQPQQLQQS